MENDLNSKIEEQIVSILQNRYNIPLELLTPEQWDTPLTSMEIGLTGYELTHLFFEIEKIYGKFFEESALKDYGFDTINNITKAITSS